MLLLVKEKCRTDHAPERAARRERKLGIMGTAERNELAGSGHGEIARAAVEVDRVNELAIAVEVRDERASFRGVGKRTGLRTRHVVRKGAAEHIRSRRVARDAERVVLVASPDVSTEANVGIDDQWKRAVVAAEPEP